MPDALNRRYWDARGELGPYACVIASQSEEGPGRDYRLRDGARRRAGGGGGGSVRLDARPIGGAGARPGERKPLRAAGAPRGDRRGRQRVRGGEPGGAGSRRTTPRRPPRRGGGVRTGRAPRCLGRWG